MIVVGGVIGAGKTTVSKKLAKELGTELFLEPVTDNPILDKYYYDRERYGFALQIYFLNKRFRLIKQAYKHKHNVLDRSIYEDALFTQINNEDGNISDEEYALYLDLLDNMMEELEGLPKKAPDLMIYVRVDFDKMLANIEKRGREYEQPTEENDLLTYYKKLHDRYDKWYEDYNYGPKMIVDLNDLDITKEEDWNKVYSDIKEVIDETVK